MTKFDPDATPQCDLWKVKGYCSAGNDMPEENFVYYADAQIVERRARVAEEKLRIAMEVLTTSCVYDYTDVQTALKEIYEVDP